VIAQGVGRPLEKRVAGAETLGPAAFAMIQHIVGQAQGD